MKYKLLLKTHNRTGLKYLCKTISEDWVSYGGSGKVWLRHLHAHGNDVITELLFECDDFEEFKKVATEESHKRNIVASREYANLIIEQGDGGDTMSGKICITDGKQERFITKDEEIPLHWRKGRQENNVFKDIKNQRKFSALAHKSPKFLASREQAIAKFKITRNTKHWNYLFGENNPATSLEVRRLISEAGEKDRICPFCNKVGRGAGMGKHHFNNCKHKPHQ